MPRRCLRRDAVTVLMLAVQCVYRRIQGLFKLMLAQGQGTNDKAFVVSNINRGLKFKNRNSTAQKYWLKRFKLHFYVTDRTKYPVI